MGIKLHLSFLVFFAISTSLVAQDYIYQTFKDTRVINSQSIETLQKRKLDVRIGHRFGDFAGNSGGWPTLYGLENAADVFIGAEYGISDRLMVGISRSKGGAGLKQLVNPMIKYKLVRQEENGKPFSLAVYGLGTVSTMSKSTNPEALNFFQVFSHRVSYNLQVILARKFSDRFSLQVTPSLTHRNLVPFGQSNDIISLGLASRVQLSKAMAFILDASIPFDGYINDADNGHHIPFGLGFEFDTGGHVFQINLTNARGMVETDYIPYTKSSWEAGEYRLGFTISRLFNL